jgi:hypothetical protein
MAARSSSEARWRVPGAGAAAGGAGGVEGLPGPAAAGAAGSTAGGLLLARSAAGAGALSATGAAVAGSSLVSAGFGASAVPLRSDLVTADGRVGSISDRCEGVAALGGSSRALLSSPVGSSGFLRVASTIATKTTRITTMTVTVVSISTSRAAGAPPSRVGGHYRETKQVASTPCVNRSDRGGSRAGWICCSRAAAACSSGGRSTASGSMGP